jgi:hypothetical protein
MGKFKKAALSLVMGVLLSAQVHADVQSEEDHNLSPKTAVGSQEDIKALFGQEQQPSLVVELSEQEMKETEGAAGSYFYRCTTCGAPHGGAYSPYFCHYCWYKR